MRPAPPSEPPQESQRFLQDDRGAKASDPGAIGGQSRSGGWWAVRIGVAVAGLGVIAAATILFIGRGGGTSLGPSHPPLLTSPPAPLREAFVFPLSRTIAVTTGKQNATATQDAATKIQATLSAFYDAAFVDSKTLRQGLPADAWNAFARAVQQQAKSDAGSLTLGEAGLTIERLSVTDASLSVRVLLDPRGRPEAAIASVIFDASGTFSGGDAVQVTNRASFLLRPAAGGTWLVVGYPSAKTDLQTPSPTPSPGASASATTSPSAGESP